MTTVPLLLLPVSATTTDPLSRFGLTIDEEENHHHNNDDMPVAAWRGSTPRWALRRHGYAANGVQQR
jgi:hypothetical protein